MIPIGVFDSGVGGLTVLRALRTAMPAENFVYLGDSVTAAVQGFIIIVGGCRNGPQRLESPVTMPVQRLLAGGIFTWTSRDISPS